MFPTFLQQSKLTMADLQTFSNNTNPLVLQLEPVAQNLGPTMRSVAILSPYLRHLFVNLGPLITAAKTGLPATRDVINGLNPLLGSLGPWLEQLNPIVDWLAIHQPLVSDFISNGAGSLAATTTAFGGGGTGHYLRQFGPTGPETLALSPTATPTTAATRIRRRRGSIRWWTSRRATSRPGTARTPAASTPPPPPSSPAGWRRSCRGPRPARSRT